MKRKIFSILFAVVLVLSFSLVTAVPVGASPDDWYVDASVTTSGDGTSWGTAFKTIQEGVDAANVAGGDTINVAAGTYDESGLKINKSLTISETGNVTITGTKGSFDSDLKFHGTGAPGTRVLGSMDYVVGVYNSADVDFVNVTIDGANNLSEPGSGQYFAGVAFYNAQGSFSGCEIKCTASSPAYCGGAAVSIYIDTDSGTWELEVSNCTFNTWPKNAISAYGSGSTLSNVLTVDVDGSTFTGNDGSGPSHGFQNGVVGLGGLDMELDNCTFSAIRPAVDLGYWAAPVLAGYAYKQVSTSYAPAHDLTVNDCTFSVTGDKFVKRSGGVWITTTGTATVSDCTFTNIKGISVDGSNSCDGVAGNFNPSSQDVTISNCTFNGPSYPASVSYYMCGVNIQRGAQVDVEGCTFSGFDDDGSTADGLGGDAVCFNLAHFEAAYYTGSCGGSVTGCTFSGCSTGIWVDQDVTPLTINCNNFDGTNEYGVWNNDTAATVDATNNWWGDASGPSGFGPGTGDAVSDYVDYSHWAYIPDFCEAKTMGYWKTHPDLVDGILGVEGVATVELAGSDVGIDEAQLIFGSAKSKNYYMLAAQLLAAKLNVLQLTHFNPGYDFSCVDDVDTVYFGANTDAIVEADTILDGVDAFSDRLAKSDRPQVNELKDILDDFNNNGCAGNVCPCPCD